MSKLKVLFFAANPRSTEWLKIDKEAREIKQEVVRALHRDSVVFETRWATRTKDLRRELLAEDPTIVHFSGHGGDEGLILESEDGRESHYVDAPALKEFFNAFHGQIRVVVLNACYSRPQAEAIAEVVGCAIGTPSRISDAAAISFSAAFYSSIAYGKSVQAAFDQARATLKMGGFRDQEEPHLVTGPGVVASELVLVAPERPHVGPPIPPSPPPGPRRTAIAGTALVLAGAAAFAIWIVTRPDPCERAREVGQAVVAAGTAAQQGLLSAPGVSANNPLAGPRALAQARREHGAGNHAVEFALYQQAAEDGSAEAMTSLGLAYLSGGEGVDEQDSVGIVWLRKAAGKDDPRGMTELANAYLRREGITRDLDHEARDWYEKAAALDYAEAMRRLGNLYEDGREVTANGAVALEWYEKAARAGLVEAMVDAGEMYENGSAVAADRRQAMCWYEAAADAGSARGQDARDRLEKS